jgi:hypothetical protein
MDQGSNDIRQNIEDTRSSLDDKLNMLEDKASLTSEKVKQAIDIRAQVVERPWTALGVAVAAGFVLGSMGGSDEPDYERYNQRWGNQPAPTPVNYNTTASYASMSNGGATGGSNESSTTEKIMEKGSDFLSQFDDEIDMLKGAAVAALTAFIRDSVREYSPKLGGLLDEQMRQRGLPVGASTAASAGARHSNASPSSTGSSSSGRQVSSASTESFHARSEMPNADYDNMGQFDRVGKPPENNAPDSAYYETYTPSTVSNTAEAPSVRPTQKEGEARKDVVNYNQ